MNGLEGVQAGFLGFCSRSKAACTFLTALKLCFSFAETRLPSETSFSGSQNSLNNLKACDADDINRMGMVCQQLAQVDARTQIGLLKIRMDWPLLL